MKKILVIDTETTGLDPHTNSLWQLAGYYRNAEGQVQAIDLKCKPLYLDDISDEALEVCHTTKADLMKLPPAQELYNIFRNFLIQETADDEKITWVGYNSRFDEQFTEQFFKHFDRTDSIWNFFYRNHVDMLEFMRLLRTVGLVNAETLKIETIYKMFQQGTETAHDALADARVTFMLYCWAENLLKKGFDNNGISL